MKRLYVSAVLCLFVGALVLATGCSKFKQVASKPKVVAVAVLTGIAASFGYLGNRVGIRRGKRKSAGKVVPPREGVSSFGLKK